MCAFLLPAQLPELLLPWYRENHRRLPWREDRDAYHIWVSEIMLQQTRVEAVKGYYARFLAELPNVQALAQCDDDRLHKLWEGLGYYNRVRNMKRAAQCIVNQHGGVFPADPADILALPGIGAYTAGAICSIAFDRPTPAVDGNVLRLCARLTGDTSCVDLPETKKKVTEALTKIYPPEAGIFTQALMELGATLCGPNWAPRCDECPCRGVCRGYAQGTAQALPVRTAKRDRHQEDRTVFIFSCGERYALSKRPSRGLLAGLWEFPNVAGKLEPDQAIALAEEMGLRPEQLLRQRERKHIFTHIQWNLRGFYIAVSAMPENLKWLTRAEMEADAALPTAFRQFLESV